MTTNQDDFIFLRKFATKSFDQVLKHSIFQCLTTKSSQQISVCDIVSPKFRSISWNYLKPSETFTQCEWWNVMFFFCWNLTVCNFMLFAIKALNPSFQMSCLTVSIQFYAVKPWFKIVTVLNECWTWIKFNLIGFKLLNMSRSFKTKKKLNSART